MLKTRSVMLAATSLAAGILTMPGWAQDISAPEAMETIVVTGIRGSDQLYTVQVGDVQSGGHEPSGETNHSYWGYSRYLPESTRMQARTIQLSARFRY